MINWDRVTRGGAAPFVVFQKVRHSSLHETQVATPLRQKRSALHHLQLFSEEVLAGVGARKKPVREGSWGSARALSLPSRRIRSHAGARAPAHQRARARHAVEGDPGAQAESVTSFETKKQTNLKNAT